MTLLDKLMATDAFVALGAGLYHGYCQAKGIKMDPNSFEASTLYGPIILMGGLNSIKAMNGEFGRPIGFVPAGLAGALISGVITSFGMFVGYNVGLHS